MPRPEKPLPDTGVLAAFAAELRTLRERAGSPTYARLAKTTGFSASTLSEAAGGVKFPSLDVTRAYVKACGGDEVEWRKRWEATRRELDVAAPEGAEPATESGGEQPSQVPAADALPALAVQQRRRRVVLVAAIAAAVLLAGGAATAIITSRGGNRHPGPTAARSPAGATPRVADGADPKDSGCAADPGVQTLDSHEVDVDGVAVGLLELRYSPSCGVAWGRITPGPSAPTIAKPAPVHFHIDAVRPGDGVTEPFEAIYIGMVSFRQRGPQHRTLRLCLGVLLRRGVEDAS